MRHPGSAGAPPTGASGGLIAVPEARQLDSVVVAEFALY
jgi:hypothetical protein